MCGDGAWTHPFHTCTFTNMVACVILYEHFHYSLYSKNSLFGTPWDRWDSLGQAQVSSLERCSHFIGIALHTSLCTVAGTVGTVFIREESLLQRYPCTHLYVQ